MADSKLRKMTRSEPSF